jgi:polar amino acid transport system substrate-binding protein
MYRRIFLQLPVCLLLSQMRPSQSMAKEQPEFPILLAEKHNEANQSDLREAFSKKVIEYLGQKAGLHFVLQPYPWKRALFMAEDGDGLIWGISRTPERELVFDFSHPIYTSHVWVVVRKDANFKVDSIADLAGKHVSLFRGSTYGAEFDKARKNNLFTVEEDTDILETRFAKLEKQRTDVMLLGFHRSNPKRVAEYMEHFGLDPAKLRILEKPLFTDPLHIAIAKKNALEFPMDALNQAIDAGHRNGEIERIVEQ